MYYTGIDLHKKTCFITTVDETGKIVRKAQLQNVPEWIMAYFDQLKEQTKVVIESMASWYWLYDLLKEKGFDVVISHPAKTKAIASAKISNDRMDSRMLAQLLRAELIATIHVSSLRVRELKELLRHRHRLVHDSTRMKNRIHMLLMKNNCQVPCRDLFGLRGLKYLKEVALPHYHRAQVDTYLNLSMHLQEQVESLTTTIHHLVKGHALAQLLMTIPGIGPITALFIIAEVEDISRFPSYRHLASYVGVVPSLDASGGKERRGHITKQGSPYLRTVLIESAQSIARARKRRLNIFFRKRLIRSGYQKAIVATAHKLVQYVFYVWKNQTPYREHYSLCA
jgi:transposase